MDKILVGTIFSDVKDYIIRDWFNNVRKFTHPNFDFCAVDNSTKRKYHEEIRKDFIRHKGKSNIKELTVLHTPRNSVHSEVFMTNSANALRNHFLKNGYRKLLYLECDIFSPKDIIERLLIYNKEMICALFYTGAKKKSYPMLEGINYYFDKACLAPRPYLQSFYDIGEIAFPKEIFSAGLGCALIDRSVIEEVPFRSDETLRFHHDTIFARDLKAIGIQNYYVPIICRHENQTWDIQRKMISGKQH